MTNARNIIDAWLRRPFKAVPRAIALDAERWRQLAAMAGRGGGLQSPLCPLLAATGEGRGSNMAQRQANIAEQLRKAIAQAGRRGKSLYRIARETGLTGGALSRLMAGTRLPTIDTAQRVAHAVGKRLVLIDS
jgi:DNA-binding phage protein